MRSHLVSYYNQLNHVLMVSCIYCGVSQEQRVAGEEAEDEMVEVDLIHKPNCPIVLMRFDGKMPN